MNGAHDDTPMSPAGGDEPGVPGGVHLAQFNISRLRQPIGHPDTTSFEDLLDETNQRAAASPGFVWRHGIDSRDIDATAYDDPLVLVNASVWESLGHLRNFAFRGFHRDVFRRRGEWMEGSEAVMWWVPAGALPTLDECTRRLWFHEQFGSSPFAFGTGERHPELVLRRHRVDDDVARALIARLDHELLSLTPDGGTNFFGLSTDEVDGDEGAFLVAWLEGAPAACGAWRRIDDAAGRSGTGEVKRMWVDPAARGMRLGASVLTALEASALAAGVSELRLETGAYLSAAVGLYRRFGFAECPQWGEYVGVAGSLTMSKALGPIRTCRLSRPAP
ncbi:MAG: GNAT family N-acetyltransferase [Ilumatobacteraceae bacterium]